MNRQIISNTIQVFDYEIAKYKDALLWPPEFAVDVRHAKLLHNLLMHSPSRVFAEIGCGGGISTTSAIEALSKGKDLKVHLCDKVMSAPVLSMARTWIDSGKLRLHAERSVAFLRKQPVLDFVFLDGDHSLKTVKAELNILLDSKVQYIAAHDTSALERALAYGMPFHRYNGPAYLREHLQCIPGWYCLEERKRRAREATVRGFFFATRNLSFFPIAQHLFDYWARVRHTKEYDCRYDPDFGRKSQSDDDPSCFN